MYKSFLSHTQLKEYLALLLEKGLVEEYYGENKQEKGFSD
jgi:predicted transcriptional regulator